MELLYNECRERGKLKRTSQQNKQTNNKMKNVISIVSRGNYVRVLKNGTPVAWVTDYTSHKGVPINSFVFNEGVAPAVKSSLRYAVNIQDRTDKSIGNGDSCKLFIDSLDTSDIITTIVGLAEGEGRVEVLFEKNRQELNRSPLLRSLKALTDVSIFDKGQEIK